MSSPTTPVDIKPLPEAITPVEACTLVIFGGSGDLARRRLIPAVYNLLLDGLLPDKYAVIGLGRKPMTDAEFRNLVREGVIAHSRQALVEDTWQAFERHLFPALDAKRTDMPVFYPRGKRRRADLQRAPCQS